MKRKITVLTLSAMLFALCQSAEAQQPKNIARIGYVFGSTPAATAHNIEAFRQGLRELGLCRRENFRLGTVGFRRNSLDPGDVHALQRSDYSLQRPTARGSRAPRAVRPMSG